MYNILICDDQPDIVNALKIYLAAEGYRLYEAYTGRQALDIVRREDIHLVLLDIMMPEMDGITATAKIREISNIPIILLTAKSETEDTVLGLNVGADDYITKPFVPVEVMARIRSQLRRFAKLGSRAPEKPDELTIGGISLNDRAKSVTGSLGWQGGYRIISLLQIFLTAALLLSLPLWKKPQAEESERGGKPLSLARIVRIPGAKAVMLCFFCYCAMEQTAGLWAASYLSLYKGVDPETAASFASMFYLGITIGRGLSGFLTIKLSDEKMVRLGFLIIALGLAAMLLPLGAVVSLAGLLLIGLGCAPVYPCLIHSTPAHFGADKSQAIIGVQMASAYVGTCLMPSLFGILAQAVSVSVLPVYLTVLLLIMFAMHTLLVQKTGTPVLP